MYLKDQGYNILGYVNESPYVNAKIFLEGVGDSYYRQGTIGYFWYQWIKVWADITILAFEHGVAGGRAMAWFSELMPILGVSSTGMVHCSTDARGGALADNCVNFWAHMNYMITDKRWQRQTNGGDEDKMLMNFDAHDGIYLNEISGMWKTEKPIYSKMLNSGVKMVITLGKYDPFYSQEQQMTWINQLEYVQGEFKQIPWSENQFGKYKV